jgi:hypothetical protein
MLHLLRLEEASLEQNPLNLNHQLAVACRWLNNWQELNSSLPVLPTLDQQQHLFCHWQNNYRQLNLSLRGLDLLVITLTRAEIQTLLQLPRTMLSLR